MEFPIYQQNWHDIQFQDVYGSDAYKDKVADASFYESFYETLFDSKTEISPSWLAQKRAVSEWVENAFLQPMRDKVGGSFRILSIGAGMGVVEEPWIKKGYHVELQECTERPLVAFKKFHPDVPVHICDGKRMPLRDKSYDIILLSGIEYIFDLADYTVLLKEVCRLLKNGGIALCISFCNLSIHGLCFNIVRRMVRRFREKKDTHGRVLWGWARTIGSHISMGRKAGMEAYSVHIFDKGDFSLLAERRPSFLWAMPTLTDAHVAIAWKRDK